VSQANVDRVRSIISAINRGDVHDVCEAVDPRVIWRGADDLPWGGTYRGHAGVAAYFARQADAVEDVRFEPYDVLDAGDCVVTVCSVSGRASGTGRTWSTAAAYVWTFRDGDLVGMHSYADSSAIVEALDGAN
jgi:ketosteroid isomerase-like protein